MCYFFFDSRLGFRFWCAIFDLHFFEPFRCCHGVRGLSARNLKTKEDHANMALHNGLTRKIGALRSLRAGTHNCDDAYHRGIHFTLQRPRLFSNLLPSTQMSSEEFCLLSLEGRVSANRQRIVHVSCMSLLLCSPYLIGKVKLN